VIPVKYRGRIDKSNFMTDDLMTEYNLFVQTLRLFPKQWIGSYFDLLTRLLNDLQLSDGAPQLAMSVTKDHSLHVNIGQRWVTKPFADGTIGLILPLEQNLTLVNCVHIGHFTKGRMNEAQWVNFSFQKNLPMPLYTAWLTASKAEVERVITKSGYRKYHSRLFYETVMRDEARKELMCAAFEKEEIV
jgi:hypothetical protein